LEGALHDQTRNKYHRDRGRILNIPGKPRARDAIRTPDFMMRILFYLNLYSPDLLNVTRQKEESGSGVREVDHRQGCLILFMHRARRKLGQGRTRFSREFSSVSLAPVAGSGGPKNQFRPHRGSASYISVPGDNEWWCSEWVVSQWSW